MTDRIRILRWRKRDRWLVLGWAAARHQEQPTPLELKHARRASILTIDAGPQDVSIEVPRALHIAHYQQVRQHHPFGGKFGVCHSSTPSCAQQMRGTPGCVHAW